MRICRVSASLVVELVIHLHPVCLTSPVRITRLLARTLYPTPLRGGLRLWRLDVVTRWGKRSPIKRTMEGTNQGGNNGSRFDVLGKNLDLKFQKKTNKVSKDNFPSRLEIRSKKSTTISRTKRNKIVILLAPLTRN